MKVKELIDLLNTLDENLEVMVNGCYGSTGYIEGEYYIESEYIGETDKSGECIKTRIVYFNSDICSG